MKIFGDKLSGVYGICFLFSKVKIKRPIAIMECRIESLKLLPNKFDSFKKELTFHVSDFCFLLELSLS